MTLGVRSLIANAYATSAITNVLIFSFFTAVKFYEGFRVSSRVELFNCTDVSRNTVSPIFRVLGGEWRPGIMWASIYT